MPFQYMTPSATFVQGRVDSADFLASAAVNAGDIVRRSNSAAIAVADIASGGMGSLVVDGGVFDIINGSNGGAFADGNIVSWDFTNKAAVNLGTSAASANQLRLGPAITANGGPTGTSSAGVGFTTNNATVRISFIGCLNVI